MPGRGAVDPATATDGVPPPGGSRSAPPGGRLGVARLWRVAIPIGVALLAAGLVISRRPDAVTHPQFYAEDGRCWFGDAYTVGPWRALLIADQGYLQLQARLVALVATPFGVASAPLAYNILGIAFQVAPAAFFVSDRFRPLVPSLPLRLVLAALYLLVPNAEINVSVANSQFHLVVLATLVLIAPPPRHAWTRAFDAGVIALTALTGDFVLLLLPACLLWWWLRRQRWSGVLAGILAVGAGIQLYAMTLAPRLHATLVTGPVDAVKDLLFIGSDHIILAGTFGEAVHAHVFTYGLSHGVILAAGVCAAGLAVTVLAALRAPWELRVFALMGLGIAGAGTLFPLVVPGTHAWDLLASGAGDDRYYFMAEVAWVVILVWAIGQVGRRRLRRGAWLLVAAAFASGLVTGWAYPPYPNDHWPREAAAIVAAAPGSRLNLPIPPNGPWSVILPAPKGC